MTVHVGGTFREIAEAEHAVSIGKQAERPFLLVTQPSLFDPSRAPAGKHTAWAYCHVPHGADEDRTQAIEAQIERFAPGFRDCVLARRVWSPADLESMDANLSGGDINAGAFNLKQVIFRPSLRAYRTGTPGPVSLFRVHSARRRRARDVRIQRRAGARCTILEWIRPRAAAARD